MRTILVHADHDEDNDARLDVALQLARRDTAHLSIRIATPFQQLIAVDPFAGTHVAAEAVARAHASDVMLEHRLRDRMALEELPWDIAVAEGNVAASLALAAVFADLVILSLHNRSEAKPRLTCMLAGDLALATRTPVLALPPGMDRIDMEAPALIAWNGSPEAAHALRAALPLLGGRDVTLVSVEDCGGIEAEDARQYLSRHGVKAERRRVKRVGLKAEERLEKEAEAMGAGLIVMGAFGHSRLRETVFGGATRHMICQSSVPLLIAH